MLSFLGSFCWGLIVAEWYPSPVKVHMFAFPDEQSGLAADWNYAGQITGKNSGEKMAQHRPDSWEKRRVGEIWIEVLGSQKSEVEIPSMLTFIKI